MIKCLPILFIFLAAALAGCTSKAEFSTQSPLLVVPETNQPTPTVLTENSVPAAPTAKEATPTPTPLAAPKDLGICSKTHTPLQSKEGYTFPENVIVTPTELYAEFIRGNYNYPHATPWKFSPSPTGACDVPTTVVYCPECDRQFAADFNYSQQLSPEEKTKFFHQLKGIKAPQSDGLEIYIVKAGDTGSHIARRYNMSFSELDDLNPGIRWTSLRIGQALKVRNMN